MQTAVFKARGRKWQTRPEVEALARDEIVPGLADATWRTSRRSRRLAGFDTTEGAVFAKKRLVRKPVATLAVRYLLGRTHSQREWRNHVEAWRRGEPVPEPLAFSERFPLHPEYDSLFVTRDFGPSLVSFVDWVQPRAEAGGGDEPRRRALLRLAELLAEMHERGSYHLDFTDSNLWGAVEGGEWVPKTVIDLEKFRFSGPGDDDLALQALQRIYRKLRFVTRGDALAAFARYLERRGLEPGSPRHARFAAWLESRAADRDRFLPDGTARDMGRYARPPA